MNLITFLHLLPMALGKIIFQDNRECTSFKNYEIYIKHFVMCKQIDVTTISYHKNPSHGLMDLLKEFYEMNFVLNKATWLHHRIIKSNIKIETIHYPTLDKVTIVNGTATSLSSNEADAIFKEKMNFIDFDMVRIYIAENFKMFLRYSQTMVNPNRFFKSARCLKVFLFSSKNVKIKQVQKLLIHLWKKYSILNIIVHFPCSSEYKEFIITYNPFKATENGYGQVNVYHYSIILKYPHILLNNLKNINGYPLKISLFERSPTAISSDNVPWFIKDWKIYDKIPTTSKYYGLDGAAMLTLSQMMNFTIDIFNDSREDSYGNVINGSPTKTLKLIINRSVDLQGNSRFMQPYNVNGYEFTYILSHDEMCIIVPKAGIMPTWLRTMDIFRGKLLGVTFLLLIACVVFNKLFRGQNVPLGILILEIYGSFLTQAVTENSNKSLAGRFFFGSFLMYCIVISTLLSATLLSVYSTTVHFPDINTMEDFNRSGLRIQSSINPFKEVPSPIYQSLAAKVQSKHNPDLSSIESALAYKTGGLERLTDSNIKIETEFSDKDGAPLLHIVPECPNRYFLSFIVPTGSPYLKIINHIMIWINEMGLNDKWYKDITRAIFYEAKGNRLKITSESKDSREKFSMDDAKSVFIFWIFGLFAALVVFILELCVVFCI
ncbi:unnamed protein product [Ceutorhynchus assimilis]|uniref:Uncharacterized protein n=1 Tax=Ceutorhynchus assimilis TaxID=467358 RepID=A0A9N9MCH2_9CUCU|nr:unnamed protein product [Ceutorhynchus assimilis]